MDSQCNRVVERCDRKIADNFKNFDFCGTQPCKNGQICSNILRSGNTIDYECLENFGSEISQSSIKKFHVGSESYIFYGNDIVKTSKDFLHHTKLPYTNGTLAGLWHDNEKMISVSKKGDFKLVGNSFETLIAYPQNQRALKQGVSCLKVYKNIAVTCGLDGNIGVWDITDPENPYFSKKLYGFSDEVTAVAVNDRFIVGGDADIYGGADNDGNINIYSLDGVFLRSYAGHTKGIKSLFLHRGMLFSSSWDDSIHISNPETGEQLQVIKTPQAYGLMAVGGNHLVAYHDRRLRFFDIDNLKSKKDLLVKEMDANFGRVYEISVDEDYLIVAGGKLFKIRI